MGTSLSGLTPATTFDGLLKVGDNDPLTSTLKAISTGEGTDTILQLSDSALSIGGDVEIETTGTWYAGFNSNLRLTANSPSIQLKDISNTPGFMIGVTAGSTLFYQSSNADFTTANTVGRLQNGRWSFGSSTDLGASVGIKGSGATSATTSLLVQNSAGTEILKVDDGNFATLSGSLRINRDNSQNAILLGNAAGSTKAVIHRGDSGGLLLQGGPTYYKNDIKVGFGQNDITFSTDSSQRMVINPTGQVGIGETTPTARLHVKGSGNDNTTTSLLVQNSDGKSTIEAKDDGEVIFGDEGKQGKISVKRSSGGTVMGAITAVGNGLYLSGYQGYSNILFGRNATEGITINNSNVRLPASLGVKGLGATSATTALLVQNSDGNTLLKADDGNNVYAINNKYQLLDSKFVSLGNNNFFGTSVGTAKVQIKGSGATSATTALLVENSAGTERFKVRDDGKIYFNGVNLVVEGKQIYNANTSNGFLKLNSNRLEYSDSATSGLDSSAALTVTSTTRGFLPPRMTTEQKNAISSPAEGLMVYDTDQNQMNYWNGTSWIAF